MNWWCTNRSKLKARTSSEFFPGGSDGRESACNAVDPGSILGSGWSHGEGSDYPLQYSGWENSDGQRSLASCSPWGHKDSVMTEWLTHTHTPLVSHFNCRSAYSLRQLIPGRESGRQSNMLGCWAYVGLIICRAGDKHISFLRVGQKQRWPRN